MNSSSNSLAQMVGQTIQQRRKMLGLSQEVLAEKVGIGQQSLSRMEQGRIAPRFGRLQLLAATLECRVADLFATPQSSPESSGTALADLMQPLTSEQRAFVLEQATRMVHFLVKYKG